MVILIYFVIQKYIFILIKAINKIWIYKKVQKLQKLYDKKKNGEYSALQKDTLELIHFYTLIYFIFLKMLHNTIYNSYQYMFRRQKLKRITRMTSLHRRYVIIVMIALKFTCLCFLCTSHEYKPNVRMRIG